MSPDRQKPAASCRRSGPPASRARAAVRDDSPLPTVANAAALAVEALRGQARTVPQLVVAFGRMLKGLGTGEGMVVPFTSPQLGAQWPGA
jgi:hypothetical protein